VADDLRYDDLPTVEADVHVDAAPEAVWRLVSDIGFPARFSTELEAARWIDDPPGPRLGARFVGHNRHPAIGAWETTCTVTDFEPLRSFGWVVGDVDDPSSAWRFTLAPDGTGTRVSQWMRMGPARSGINLAIDAMPEKEGRILARRLEEHRANMLRNLEALREVAGQAP
jgi:uncharacterized protein YndB with AHSA1/START domain